jgi:peroxiredoxin Q/BCP
MKSMIRSLAAVLGLSLALGGGIARAQELKVGDKAPDFSLKGSDGKTYSLADFKGKQGVVLAWFPKADTSGCTAECKSFKSNGESLKGTKVAYFTISVDKPEDNVKFSEKYGFDFPILSDPEKTTAAAYGVLRSPKGVANRWTFYIDKEGVIKEIDKQITTTKAGEDAIAKIKSLGIGG